MKIKLFKLRSPVTEEWEPTAYIEMYRVNVGRMQYTAPKLLVDADKWHHYCFGVGWRWRQVTHYVKLRGVALFRIQDTNDLPVVINGKGCVCHDGLSGLMRWLKNILRRGEGGKR